MPRHAGLPLQMPTDADVHDVPQKEEDTRNYIALSFLFVSNATVLLLMATARRRK